MLNEKMETVALWIQEFKLYDTLKMHMVQYSQKSFYVLTPCFYLY